jgi:hypothetical protein
MKIALTAAAAAALAFAAPAAAQEVSYTPGTYWEVAMVDVEDGKEQDYIDFLADQYRKSNEFAKQKGYIEGYHILSNVNRRPGEPDLYLVVEFKRFYDTAEELRQQKEYEAFMKRSERQMSAESGARGTMRTLMGSMLWRELNLKPR